MAYEPFLINPARKGGRKKASAPKATKRRRRKRATKASAPKRQTRKRTVRRKRRASVGTGPVGSRHRPVVYTVKGPKGGSRWRTSPKAKVARPGVFINPGLAIVGGNPMRRRHRRYRRNPPVTVRGFLGTFQRTLPLAITGVASGVVTDMAPGMIGLVNPWARLGTKAAVAVLGGPMVGNLIGRDHGDVWTIVGVARVVTDLVKQFMPGVIPGLSDYPGYYDEMTYSGMQAFPEEVSAFPEEVGAYDVGQVDQPWPYSGEYGY